MAMGREGREQKVTDADFTQERREQTHATQSRLEIPRNAAVISVGSVVHDDMLNTLETNLSDFF